MTPTSNAEHIMRTLPPTVAPAIIVDERVTSEERLAYPVATEVTDDDTLWESPRQEHEDRDVSVDVSARNSTDHSLPAGVYPLQEHEARFLLPSDQQPAPRDNQINLEVVQQPRDESQAPMPVRVIEIPQYSNETVVMDCGVAEECKNEQDEKGLHQVQLNVGHEETKECNDLLDQGLNIARAELDNSARSSEPMSISRTEKYTDHVSLPLSQSTPCDNNVHNDFLKVILVAAPSVNTVSLARRLCNKEPLPRALKSFRVDVNYWCPNVPTEGTFERPNVQFSVWAVQGCTADKQQPNFGAHPGVQSIFYSPRSLYLLVWDLAEHNAYVERYNECYFDDDDVVEIEKANREADRALRADLQTRVLSWFDCIAQHGPHSVIVPVALIPQNMPGDEVERRRNMMQVLLTKHYESNYDIQNDISAPQLLVAGKEDTILSVENVTDYGGIRQLQEWIMAVANDPSRPVFGQVGSPVPMGTVCVRKAVLRLKEDHSFIMIDHLLGAIGDDTLPMDSVIECLRFLSSVGEILYFGGPYDGDMSRIVVLSLTWLTSALLCILQNELDKEIKEARTVVNVLRLHDGQEFEKHEVIHSLLGNSTSNCPLLSTSDARSLWLSYDFMREATYQYAKLFNTPALALVHSMFVFFEEVMLKRGVFLPFNVATNEQIIPRSDLFFVPSLLGQAAPPDLWSYKSRHVHLGTLCHSWLFRDGAPAGLFETITVNVLRAIYDLTKDFSTPVPCPDKASRMGHVRIHHIICYKAMMYAQLGTKLADAETGALKQNFVELFIAIVDQNSSYCVASNVMNAQMQRVIVR